MNTRDLIKRYEDHCKEYLEMVEDKGSFIANVLAHRVLEQQEYIDYLHLIIKRDFEAKYAKP